MPTTHTKPSDIIFNTLPPALLLGFLFMVNFTIAGSYLCFSLLLLILFAEAIRARRLPPTPDYFKYLLLYVLFSFISTLFSLNFRESLDDNREFFVFLLIPICLMAIKTRKILEYSLYAVLASSVLSSLLGIVISLWKGVSLDHRLKGLTSHWMTYSGLLMFAFVFFFISLFYEKNKRKRLLISASLLPILAAILLSLTRSAWVGTFVALAAFVIYFKPRILFFAIPAALILGLLLPGSVRSRLLSTFDLNNETNRDRIYMAQTGLEIFKKYPLVGAGPNQIKKIYDQYKPAEAALSNPHLHNNLIQILAERGVLTLLGLLAAFAAIVFSLVKKIDILPRREQWIPVGALFTFIAFFISGFFEYNFGDTEIRFILFYFLSIPYLPLLTEKTIKSDPPLFQDNSEAGPSGDQ